jgi:hypothetical protein
MAYSGVHLQFFRGCRFEKEDGYGDT